MYIQRQCPLHDCRYMSFTSRTVKASLAHAAHRVLFLASLGVDAGLGLLLTVDAQPGAMSVCATHSEEVTTHLVEELLQRLAGEHYGFILRLRDGHDVMSKERWRKMGGGDALLRFNEKQGHRG